MQKLVSVAVACILCVSAIAQYPGGGRPGGRTGGAGLNVGHFYGKIVDSKTNRGIDAASVQLIQGRFDTASKKMRDTIYSGMLTRPNGDFSLENLPVRGNYRLTVTAIGYKPI